MAGGIADHSSTRDGSILQGYVRTCMPDLSHRQSFWNLPVSERVRLHYHHCRGAVSRMRTTCHATRKAGVRFVLEQRLPQFAGSLAIVRADLAGLRSERSV